MKTIMNEKDLNTVDQVQQFLIGTQLIAFQVLDDKVSRYKWIQSTLIRFNYGQLKRQEKGILIRYMAKISGLLPAAVNPTHPTATSSRSVGATSAHQ